jgi:hypothetical protein
MFKRIKRIKRERLFLGLTMIEALITISILVFVLVGCLRLFLYCSKLAQMARNFTFAMSEAQAKLEEMRYYSFDRIVVDYGGGGAPGNKFNLSQLDGMGRIYINSANSEMLQVDIVISYRSAGGHIVGEDSNFNGELDGGEDDNGNNRLDSPASLVSFISKR